MIIAHVYDTEENAARAFKRDAFWNMDKVTNYHQPKKVYKMNGDEHWYMGSYRYET